MKNGEITRLLQGIANVVNLSGVKFAYAMSKNKKSLTAEAETLNESVTQSEEYKKYDKLRVELCEKHAKKDDKDKPKIENNAYVMVDKEAFDKELEVLNGEHKEVLDIRETQIKEFNELLTKESTFVPFKVAFDEVPEDITVGQMESIELLIEDKSK